MKRNEKWIQRIKKATAMLLISSLVLGSVPASVLASGSARLSAASETMNENIQEKQEEPVPSTPQEAVTDAGSGEQEKPLDHETGKETAEAAETLEKTSEEQAAENVQSPAETPEEKEPENLSEESGIMEVGNPLRVVEAPESKDAEIGESVVLSAHIEAQDPAGVTYQWQAKNGGDAGVEAQSTDEALEQKKSSLEAAESIDLTGITGEESPEAAEAVQNKAKGIAEAKTRPIEPDNEGWTDIAGATGTELAVSVDSETAGKPVSYRMVARTSEAAIATPAAMIRTNADFEEGSGTERDPYIIATNQQLWNLHKYEGTASKGKYWRLRPVQGTDLFTDGVPIGQLGRPFMGTLDGDGYRIRGERVNTSDMLETAYVPIPAYDKNGGQVTAYGCALFGFLKDATIVNLNVRRISSGDVSVPKVSGTNVAIAAGAQMAAAGENATIENCYTEGNSIYDNDFASGEYQMAFLWQKEKINVYRYLLGGGIVACGTVGDGYSVRFTGTIANSHTIPWLQCVGGNLFKNFAQTGSVYPNTSLEEKYRPRLVNVYSSKSPLDLYNQNKITPGSTEIPAYSWNPVTDQFNDYVVKGDRLLNYWRNGGIHPEINTRGVLNFRVSDYVRTYDGSVQKATVNCAWKETQRGRDWDYIYKNDKGAVVGEESVKLPGTYNIEFEEKNRDYHLGRVDSSPADVKANPFNARMIVNPIADREAPVCNTITYTDEEGKDYKTGAWTDQDVTVTFNINDFTKGGNYDTLCDSTPYTVDQEGHEISGMQAVTIKDANGNEQAYTQDGAGNYTVKLHVEKGKQLTTTLTASMEDKKGHSSSITTEYIKINKSDINIEVTAQKDNDEEPTILTGGSSDGYSMFAKRHIRFDAKAAMNDNSLYVSRMEYKFVPVGADEASVSWATTDFEDQQNPHSITMNLEEAFDGTLYIHAASVNGKNVTVSYKVMLEEHQPMIQSIEYTGYKGQTDSGSVESVPAGYHAGSIYHKVDLKINYEDTLAEKSGIAKAEIFRADNNELLASKVVSGAPGGQGPVQDSVILTCNQTGDYAVNIVLTDKAGNSFTSTSDVLCIEAAAPVIDTQWAAPVDGDIYGFDKWCDQDVTVTLQITNNTDTDKTNDIANKVNYYYRRAKRDNDINDAPWVKINQDALNPTETLNYTVTEDGNWQYEFKAATEAAVCNDTYQKKILIDRSPLDIVALTPQDVLKTDSSDVVTEPGASGWFTDAGRTLKIGMSLSNNGESRITGKYEVTYQPAEDADESQVEVVANSQISTEVGAAPSTAEIPCDKEGIYKFKIYSETDSGRGSVAKIYTYRVDRTKPVLNPSQFIIAADNKKELRSWTDEMISGTGTRYFWYANQQGELEINAQDTASGVDKIEYQICGDIDQTAPAADGVWQLYDQDHKPVFAPEFKGNVFIRVTDKAGLVMTPAEDGCEYSHSSSFYLDDKKPMTEVTANEDLSQWQTDVTFNVKVSDLESGIKFIHVLADNDVTVLAAEIEGKTPEEWKALGIENLAYKKEPSGIYSEVTFTYHSNEPSVNKGTGKKFTLDAEDNSGNAADAIEKNYKIDNVTPEIEAVFTDGRESGKWYNEAPGLTIKNTRQAVNPADAGKTHTLSGVRYYYRSWKSGTPEPDTWTVINETPTEKTVGYTYPDEADASLRFKAVNETGLEGVSAEINVKVDRTNPDKPAVSIKNSGGTEVPDGNNGWYKGAWPTITIPDSPTNPQKALESIFYKLYTGNDSSKAQTATKGQSILNSSFNQDGTSPGIGAAPGIFRDQNNQKDQLAATAGPGPADPAVMAEGARAYKAPDLKESNKLNKPNIKVLNLYPGDNGKVLIKWMCELAGAESQMTVKKGNADSSTAQFEVKADNGEVITLDITQVSISDFNANADSVLKNGGSSFAYDLIYVGAADSNGNQDIATGTLGVLQNYMNAGNGFLVGHDAFSNRAPNITRAMQGLANITPAFNLDTSDVDPDFAQYTSIRTTTARVVKSGKITTFPFLISDKIPIKQTHNQYQFAKGDVWVQFADDASGQLLDKELKQYKGEKGTSNFYLTTSGNVGMSQVGHTTGYATTEEEKLLVNTMVSLAQKPTSQFTTTTGEPQAVTAIIRTEEQLKAIGTDPSYPADKNGVYVLGDNIAITDGSFSGISNFAGSFDGGGYKITLSGAAAGKALFTNTSETARLMNFDISGGQLVSGANAGQITHCSSTATTRPLVGVSNSGSISYCTLNTTGLLTDSGITPTNTGTIQDCKVTGNISSSSANLGGIAGQSSGAIQNCEYSGTLTATAASASGHIGGIAGTASGSLTRCKTSGTLTAANSLDSVGGIVGLYSAKALSDCENAMTVTAAESANVGGVAGKIQSGSISSCESTGAVSGKTAGGIAGVVEKDASVRNTINSGAVTGSVAAGGLTGSNAGGFNDSKTTANVSGAPVMGGAVGENAGSIVNCYAAPGAIIPTEQAAGFVGKQNNGSINTCATTANSFAGTNYMSNKDPEIAADGVYTLETWSKDAATRVDGTGQNTSGMVKETIMVDTRGPAPFSASVENNTFTELLHSLTFGLFFDKTTDVVLEAGDDVSGIDSIEYTVYKTDQANTDPGANEGTPVETKRVSGKEKVTFSVTPDFQGYVRATATDRAGNATELSTDGIIINSTLPRVKATATKNSLPYDGDWSKDNVSVSLEYIKTDSRGNLLSGNFSKYQYSVDNGTTWRDISVGDNNSVFTASAVSGTTQILTFDKPTSQNFMFRAAINGRTDSKTVSETTAVSIKIDKKSPTAEMPVMDIASALTNSDNYAVYSQQPTLSVTASDDPQTGLIDGVSGSIASGLKSQTYKLTSGGAVKPYTSPLVIEDGKYDFEFTATDGAGQSATAASKFIVDTMTPKAPVLTATAGGTAYDGGWTDKEVTITAATNDPTAPLSGYDGATGIKYAVYKDGVLKEDWQDYSGSGVAITANIDGSNDGSFNVCFKVVSQAGHESPESMVNVNIQKTPPSLSVEANGRCSEGADAKLVWSSQPVTLEVSTDGVKLSGQKSQEAYTVYDKTHKTITVTEDGITTYRFKSENKSKQTKESGIYKIALDQKAPEQPAMSLYKDGTEQSLDNGTWYDDSVLDTLKIKDKTTETGEASPRTLYYRVYNNGAVSVPDYITAAGTEASVGALIKESGTWIIEAYTQDEAGNTSPLAKQVFNYAKADNLPVLEISFDNTVVKTLAEGNTPVYAGSVNAAITAKDDRVGIKENSLKFKLVPDAGTKLRYGEMTRYTGPVEIENFKGAIEAEVENNAGQKKTVSARICADSEKPSVSITEAGNKSQKKWAKESFSLQVNGGENTVSGFEKYQYYDAGGNTWVDFTEADRINPGIDHLWKNVKYDVTDNGKALVKVRSVNNAGIASDEKTFEVWKDDTEAKIDIEVNSDLVDGVKWSKDVVFTPKLLSAAPPSGIDYYYREGGGDPWKKMAGDSLTIRKTTPGAGQTYEFKAVSGTGNESGIVSESAFIDGEKPKEPVLAKNIENPDGENGWYITRPQISVRENGFAGAGLDIDDEQRSAVKTEYQLSNSSVQAASSGQFLRSLQTAAAPAEWKEGGCIPLDGEGVFNFMTRSRDAADNLSDLTARETVKVDTKDPAIADNDIEVRDVNGGKTLGLLGGILFNDTIEVSVTAHDVGSGVYKITYQLGNDNAAQKTLTADGNGRVSFRLSPKQGVPLNTSLKLTATDLAGRESAPVTIDNLLLEAEKPEVSITPKTAPNDKGWYKGVLPYTVTARDSDAGLETVRAAMDQNGSETVVANDTVDAADSKNTKQYNSTITQSGSAQRVTVEAKDRAGNTQTVEKTFKVETAAPALGVSFTLMDGADTSYTDATSYNVCAALTYDEPVSGVEDLQVSTDHGSTWSSVSDALGKKHVISSETNADYQFRLVTNAGNVSAATAPQKVVINRKMPGAPAIEVKDQNGSIMNEAWSNQDQTATVLVPSCDDAGVRQATEYEYQTYKDSTADASRTGTIAPSESGQSVALTDFTEEGEYVVKAWGRQKDSGLQDTENICEKKVMVDKTPPDASQTNASFFMDNGRLKLKVLVNDALSGGGSVDYTITKNGAEGPSQTMSCDVSGQAVLDVNTLGAGDRVKIKKVYDKAGNGIEQTGIPDLTIPGNINLTKIELQITPGETTIAGWYHDQPLTANAHITVEGGSKPEDIKDDSGNVLKAYPDANSITKVNVTYPDNRMVTLDYTRADNSGQTETDVPITDITGEGEDLVLRITAYDAWDNSAETTWQFKNDATPPDKPGLKLTTSEGELGSDGRTDKDITLTVIPDETNENQTNPDKKKTSPLSSWQYSLDGGVTWSEQYSISSEASSLSRVIASKGGLDTDSLVVRVSDLVGNTSVNSEPKSVHVTDTAAPINLSITEADGTSPVDSAWDNRKADRVLKVHAADPAEGVISFGLKEWNYSLDGGNTWQTANIPWDGTGENNIPIAGDGVYAVTFRVWDAAGNLSQLDSAAEVRKDQTAPEVKEQDILFEQQKGADNWIKAAIHWLSFGNFFNDTIRVTVPVEDGMSGNHSLTYSVDGISTEVVVNDGKAVFTLPVNGVKDQTLAVWAKDIAGNVSETLPVKGRGENAQWTTENSGPIIGDAVTSVTANAAGWYTQDIPVSVRIEDMDSGLAAVSWQLNDEPEQTVMPSEHERKDSENIEINITEDGVNTLTVKAADNAGNTAERSYSFKLDHGQELAAYITELSGDPVDPDRWRSEETVRLKANMAVGESDIDTWQYTLDGGQTWTAPEAWGDENILEIEEDGVYSQPQAARAAGQQNLIAVRVTDMAGNQKESPYESIKKDSEAPAFAAVQMDEANGNVHENVHWYKDRKPSVRLVPEMETAGKAPVTHTFTLNGEPVVFDSETELREWLKEGENILRVYAKDAAGNEAKEGDQNYIEKVFYIDTEAPEIGEASFKDIGNKPIEKLIHWLSFGNFYNEAVQVTVPVTDAASGCEALTYNIGGQSAQAPVKDGKASFEIPMDTDAKVTCHAEDTAGNETGLFAIGKESSQWVLTRKIEVPNLWINGEAASGGWYNQPVSYELLVSCPEAGIHSIKQTMDNGEPVMLGEAVFAEGLVPEYRVTGELSEDGVHQMLHVITDNAGNKTQRGDFIKIDQTAPKGLAITGAPENGEALEPQTLTVLANDSIEGIETSGLKAWSYTLDGGKTWTEPQLWNQKGENTITVEDARAYDISFKVWDHAGNVSELSEMERVRFTITSDNPLTRVTTVVNPVTGLHFTAGQLLGLAGCLMAIAAAFMVSLIWYRKNRRQ